MKRIILLASIVAMAFVGISAQTDATRATRVTAEDEYYIFQLNNEVTRTHVYYDTRFGIEIVGDLYVAKNIDKSKKHPAIVIGPPYGGVKEQGPTPRTTARRLTLMPLNRRNSMWLKETSCTSTFMTM